MNLSAKDHLIKLIATGLYSSSVPPWPGTTGTIPAWLIAFFLIRGNQMWLGLASVVCFFVSVAVATAAERFMGHDSRYIVIDEWIGMFIAVLFVPWSLTNYLLAFVAFRLLDAIKVPPAAQLEALPRGWGVTMDDVIAGLQANVVVQIFLLLRSLLS